MKYKQLSLFQSNCKPNPTLTRCWRCGEYFPFDKIRIFDAMYPTTGRVGTYQACDSCYDVIRANNGVVCDLGDERV